MAGTITHEWNGTTLTITSDSGTSSMDLKGATGAIGPRGPQGPAGTVTNNTGNIDLTGYATENYVDQKIADVEAGVVDLSGYYTKEEIDNKIGNVELDDYYTKAEADYKFLQEEDLSGLATESFVSNKIAEAQLSGDGEVDLTGFATQDDLAAYRLKNNNTFNGTVVTTDGVNTMNLGPTGIVCGTGAVDIAVTGEAHFTDIYSNDKLVATQEYVDTKIAEALAALINGDEVSY